jgi:hypothetical protein
VQEKEEQKAAENVIDNEKSIADNEMQERLTPAAKRRKTGHGNASGSGKHKKGQTSRYFEG